MEPGPSARHKHQTVIQVCASPTMNNYTCLEDSQVNLKCVSVCSCVRVHTKLETPVERFHVDHRNEKKKAFGLHIKKEKFQREIENSRITTCRMLPLLSIENQLAQIHFPS